MPPAVKNLAYQVDEKQLLAVTETLKAYPRGLPTVLSRAINKTTVWARKQLSDEIRQERPGLTAAAIREAIRLYKANAKVLQATARITGKRVPLIDLGARQSKGGTSYRTAAGPRAKIREAFVQTMASGHRGVFVRSGQPRTVGISQGRTRKSLWTSRGLGKTYRPRLPIRELFGPSVPQVAGDMLEQRPETLSAVQERLAMEIDRQVEVFLQQQDPQPGSET